MEREARDSEMLREEFGPLVISKLISGTRRQIVRLIDASIFQLLHVETELSTPLSRGLLCVRL